VSFYPTFSVMVMYIGGLWVIYLFWVGMMVGYFELEELELGSCCFFMPLLHIFGIFPSQV